MLQAIVIMQLATLIFLWLIVKALAGLAKTDDTDFADIKRQLSEIKSRLSDSPPHEL